MEIYQDILRIRSLCNDLRATIRRLEAMPVVIHDKTHVERRTEEFRRICALRRVLYAAVDSHNAISIVVNATYVYKGIPYDLGDWTVRFGALPPDLPFEVLKYRRNVRPGQERIYPDYIMNGDQFCLGPSNRPLIEKHFENERYLQAITVIIGVVNSVNADDVDMVPKVFFPKIPTTIGAITWPLFTNGPMTYT